MKKRVMALFAVLLTSVIGYAQLSGVKTIPGTYPTVAAAIADLNTQGVGTGGVTFNVAAGYAESFTSSTAGDITTPTGSAGSPIVFQKSGSGVNPKITAFQLPAASSTAGIIKLAGTDYVTFDGIDVAENALNTSNKTNWGFAILMATATDASQHILIKNCSITLDKTNTSSRGIYSGIHTATSITALTPTDPLGTVSYCNVDNCNISNVYTGISFTAYNAASPYTLYGQSNRFGYTVGNNITNFGGGSVQPYAIFTIYQNNLVIARNTINGGAGTTTGLNGIYNNTSNNANVDIYLNNLTLTSSATLSNSMYGICNIGSSIGTTNTVNIYNNTVENCTQPAAGNGNWYMIINMASSQTSNVYNNVVRNNTRPASGGTIYLINLALASVLGTENVYNNQLYGNSVSGAGSSVFYSLYCNNPSASKNIYSNLIYGNSTSGSSIYGIYTANGTTANIYQNSMYDLTTNHTTGLNYGIRINGGTNTYCYNNIVSDLKAPVTSSSFALRGITVDNGTTAGLYYNTIYLNGTGTGTNFGSSCVYANTAVALDMRNNILVNSSIANGTGLTTAYRRSDVSLYSYAGTSGNNDLFAGIPGPKNLVFYDGTNSLANLPDYKSLVSPADANSFTEMPPFINTTTTPYDLHINTAIPCQSESGGGVVATPMSITGDFSNTPRFPNSGYPNNAGSPATAPDAGAYEFGGMYQDLTPPGIVYAPLSNTSLLTNRTLTTTITDRSGVPQTGNGRPVCYWKINSGAFTAAQGTWVSGNSYTFSFGAGVALGDIVSYYIVAQDLVTLPNVGANPSAGSSGFSANPPACSTPPGTPHTYTILPALNGIVTVGSGGNYPSLTGAGGLFQDINSKVLTGNVTAKVISNLSEDGTYGLNKWIEDPPGNFALKIQPDGNIERLIEGSVAGTMIRFSGARRASIDGRYNGSGKYLRFRNNNTAYGDFEFSNDAMYDTLRSCYWESGNTSSATTSTGIIRIYNTNGVTGNSNNTIIDNVIRNISSGISQPYTGIFTFGSANAYNVNNTISGNEILNFTSYGIYISTNNSSVVMSGNSLYNNMATPLTTTPRCIYIVSGAGGDGNIIAGNYIGGSLAMCGGTPWIHNSSGGLYGIYLSAGSVVPTEVYGNVFSNIHSIHTGSGGFYGIYGNTTGVFHVGTLGGNVIGSATVPGSILLDGTNVFRGIYISGSSPDNTVENNLVGNVTWSVATGSQSSIHGLYVSAGQVRKNKVFMIGSSQTGFSPTIYGLYNSGAVGTVNEYSNNMVDLDGGAAANPTLYGFWENAANTSGSSLFFNTIYIHGPATTTSSTYTWRRGGTAANTMKDNIFFNDRAAGGTGSHYAVYDAVTASLTSDYNDFYSTAGPLGYYAAANVPSLSAWQTSTAGDSQSLSVNPAFVSTTDLHPTLMSLNNAGISISGITTDFAGITRGSPPDIGALEFFAVPVIVTTAATSVTGMGATLNGTVNANGESVATTFNLGLTASYGSTMAATPSAVTGNTVTPISASVSSLAPSTTYHFRAVGTVNSVPAYGNDMTFTTGGLAPSVITTPANAIGAIFATLNGTVNANNQDATVTFEYGLTTSYGTMVPATPGTVTGFVVTPFSSNITGLSMNTTYHFRAVSVNATGTTYGNDLVFTTGCLAPAPAGAITGLATLCQSTSGVTYNVGAIANATSYAWTVPAGATISAGAGTNSITVDFGSTAVPGIVSVYGTGVCGNGTPSNMAVSVYARPVPVISGPATVCIGTAGNVYTTAAGMSGYSWSISAGGIITAGAGSNAITVLWNNTGPQTVCVNYNNANGCGASAPVCYNVTVSALPVPIITGPNSACVNTPGIVYATQAGMTNYTWTVSPGGTITAGGSPTSNTVTVTWTTTGAKTVSVNYTNTGLCTAATPSSYNITVNPILVPTIGSTNDPCVGSSNNVYYTESGMTGYVWTVSSGGTIASGQGTSTIYVTWNQVGAQTVSVNYTNTTGCAAPSPAVYTIYVNAPPAAAGAITGTASVCAGTNGVAYTTTPIVGVNSYTWTVPGGATIVSGAGTTSITVDFGTSALPGNLSVSGTNSCGNGPSSTLALTVNPLPAAAGTIAGPASVCAGATGIAYSVPAIANATTYVWTVPAGATITSGSTTRNIVVSFGTTTGTGVITVKGSNTCGNGTASANFSVSINAVPSAPVVTVVGNVLTSSAPTGNQWYYEGTMIAGATGQTYTVTNNTGNYWCVVTLEGCTSPLSNKVWMLVTGQFELESSNISVYPVPSNGMFTASVNCPGQDAISIAVYNQLGVKVYHKNEIPFSGSTEQVIDLRPVSPGVYMVVFSLTETNIIRKIIIK